MTLKNLKNILLAENEIFNIPYKIKIQDDLLKRKLLENKFRYFKS